MLEVIQIKITHRRLSYYNYFNYHIYTDLSSYSLLVNLISIKSTVVGITSFTRTGVHYYILTYLIN